MLILQSRTRVPSTGKRAAERLEDMRARVRRRIEDRARSSGGETLTAEQRARIAANRAAATVKKLAKEAARGKEEEAEETAGAEPSLAA